MTQVLDVTVAPAPTPLSFEVVDAAGESLTISVQSSAPPVAVQVGGEIGPPGPPGARGDAGPPGAGNLVIFPFNSPAATWTVHHDLGRFPILQLVGDDDAQFDADVEFPDPNTAVITHAAPRAGTVLVS